MAVTTANEGLVARLSLVSVALTDHELALLDGRCSDKVQQAVDAGKARLAFIAALPDVDAAVARLVADTLTEATTNGILGWQRRKTRSCGLCGKAGEYVKFKTGPRRGKPNYDRFVHLPGIELATRFVTVEGHITLGGCVDCLDAARPHLVAALVDVPAQLPDPLYTPGRPRYRKHSRRRCPQCGWAGHEGEMRRLSTVMGDGTYPGGCPACPFESRFLGKRFDSLDGFDVVVPADADGMHTVTASPDGTRAR